MRAAICGSFVTSVVTRLPRPRAASSSASASLSYGINVLTGPNASTSCTAASDANGLRHASSVGAKNAPASTPSPFGENPSRSP